jgi:hypothetical protein
MNGAHNRSAIGTLVERSSRFTILLHLPGGRHTADVVRDAHITPFAARRTTPTGQLTAPSGGLCNTAVSHFGRPVCCDDSWKPPRHTGPSQTDRARRERAHRVKSSVRQMDWETVTLRPAVRMALAVGDWRSI